jgi:hypothetical protein
VVNRSAPYGDIAAAYRNWCNIVVIFRANVVLIASLVRSYTVLFLLQRVKQTKGIQADRPTSRGSRNPRSPAGPSAALRDQLVAEIEQQRRRSVLNGGPFRLPTTLDPQ